MNNQYAHLTYEDKRACPNCGKPIADQEHATRKYCEKYYDQSGKVHDCKTDYNRTIDKPEREIHSTLIRDQKFFAKQISDMVSKKGYEVTTDDLTAYDISLPESLKLEIKSNGTAISHFLQYIITSYPVTNTHKITCHEQQ
jgi:ribosomal protein S27AE